MYEPARKLRPLDRVLIATLVPLYLAALSIQLNEGVKTGLPRAGIEVASAPGVREFPVVYLIHPDSRFEGPRLEVGDRLLAVGDRSLAGASLVEFLRLALPGVRREAGARLTAARGETRMETTLLGESDPYWWSAIPQTFLLALVSLLILLRAPGWPPARRYFISATALGVYMGVVSNPTDFGPLGQSAVPGIYLALAALPIGLGTAVSVYWDFTASARPLPAWVRAQPWVIGLVLFPAMVAFHWLPAPVSPISWIGYSPPILLAMISILVGLTRCYIRADALERRQLRWVLYGWYVGLVPRIVLTAMHPLSPMTPYEMMIANAASLAGPAGILIAVLGYRLFDIDRLISATTSLTVLGVILHEVILHVIPDLAETASHAMGVSVEASKWTLSVAFGAVVLGAHGRLRPWIDRCLFGPRVSVEEGLGKLIVEIARCRSAQELTELTAERLHSLLGPESLVVYARAESAFAPVFARGRAVPPAVAADGPLVRVLELRHDLLAASSKEIDPFDRAVLATLDTEVLIPIRRGGTLVAFICLGRKRSRDIYTPAELALFTAVSSANGEVLQGLGDAEVIEQGRAMQASLRRYVPGAIAEQLESGRAIEAGEREVTVLFVDLRGYSTYAEKRPVEDVFSTVNEHTERVSRIVRARGGAVVEFNGDGMMAVFGAPEVLAAKERQAIEAAREIVDTSPSDLAVGIGIATGLAYAGNIRAADRWIWSVIGDTTNLAARLQALTRDLHASIAIDEPTRRAAGYVCADFARHADVSIRGRSQRLDVFALPLARASAA